MTALRSKRAEVMAEVSWAQGWSPAAAMMPCQIGVPVVLTPLHYCCLLVLLLLYCPLPVPLFLLKLRHLRRVLLIPLVHLQALLLSLSPLVQMLESQKPAEHLHQHLSGCC
jgi:hypothetical protein